jgi:hypothetical protein
MSTGLAQGVEAGAELRANLRMGVHDCLSKPVTCPWLDFQDAAVFAPWAEARPDPRIIARGAVDFRLHGPSAMASLEDASDPGRLQASSMRIQDAWIGTRGQWLDIRLGADRLTWGVADGFSVVDRLNPWDLTDPTRFDRRLSVPLGLLLLHKGSLQLELVALPFFQPAALPASSVDLTSSAGELFDAEATGAGEMDVGTLESRLSMPETGLESTTVGARLRWSLPFADLGLSWTSGPDTMPQVDGDISLIGFQTDQDRVDLAIPMRFPRVSIGGFEMRTELPADTSAWAELALVLPERTVASTSEWQLQALLDLGTISQIPDPLPQTITQDGDPYLRWIGGVARYFGPVYLQAQWLRGFPTERQQSDLRDYLLTGARWSLSPTVKLELGGVTDFEAYMTRAELAWLVADSAEFQLGAAWIDGQSTSSLAAFESISHVRSGVIMSF